MNTISIKRTEEKLLRRRNEIMPVLEQLAYNGQEASGNYQFDWSNEPSAGGKSQRLDRLTGFYRSELAEIERALRRIHSGTFGFCLACHQRMPSARLARLPQAELCRRCEETKDTFEERGRLDTSCYYG